MSAGGGGAGAGGKSEPRRRSGTRHAGEPAALELDGLLACCFSASAAGEVESFGAVFARSLSFTLSFSRPRAPHGRANFAVLCSGLPLANHNPTPYARIYADGDACMQPAVVVADLGATLSQNTGPTNISTKC